MVESKVLVTPLCRDKGTCKSLFYTPFGFAYTAGHMKYSKAIGLTGRQMRTSLPLHAIFSRDSHWHMCANGFKQPSAVFAEQINF